MPIDAITIILLLIASLGATPPVPMMSPAGETASNGGLCSTVIESLNDRVAGIKRDEAIAGADARVNMAREQVNEASRRVEEAQQTLDSEPAIGDDPGTNEGHIEWTALGLYQHIANNTSEDDPEHWDAQAAIDILGGGENSTGYDYAAGNGPVPDGMGTVPAGGFARHIDFSDRADAVSLDNLVESVDWIDEYNRCRARENETMGTSLPTDIGLSCRLMAVSAVHLDVSCDPNAWMDHTWIYGVGENLAWGYSNPFDGWYDEEKNEFLSTGSVSGHHYFDIVDDTTQAVGFATSQYGSYRVAYEQSFHLGYNPGNPSVTYTTDEFRERWLNPYYDEQVRAGMHGFTEEQHAEHVAILEEAQSALTEAQAELDAANAELLKLKS